MWCETSSFNNLGNLCENKKTEKLLLKVNILHWVFLCFWQQGGRCVECLVLVRGQGGQRRPEDITASSHLALSPASGPRSQAKAGAESRDEARGWCGGEAAPIRGQRSKGSPLSYPSSNRRREITIGNTIWNACLLHGQEIKKAIETQTLKSPLYLVFQWDYNTRNLLQLNPSSSHTQFAMVNIWGNLIKMWQNYQDGVSIPCSNKTK